MSPESKTDPLSLFRRLAFALASLVSPAAVMGQQTWRVADRPSLTIGSRDAPGPELFGSVVGAFRLGSGNIVVADRKNLELRYFSPTGKYLRTSGRKGGGPGEFQHLSIFLGCAGDSAFVYDVALQRMSVFDPDGIYVRAVRVLDWSSNGYAPYDISCGRAGTIALVNRSDRSAELPKAEGPLRHDVEITLIGRNDSSVSLGKFPASEMYFRAPAAGPRHLGRRTTVAVGSSSAYVGTGDTYEVAKFSLRGERVGTIRESHAPVLATPAHVAAYVTEYMSRNPGRSEASVRRYFGELEWPEVLPAYARLMVDRSDNLWIEQFPIPGKETRDWIVYGSSGQQVAVIALPRDFRVLEAGPDYVLGVWRDEFDVEYVRVYSLLK
jgi:hypothetical protein